MTLRKSLTISSFSEKLYPVRLYLIHQRHHPTVAAAAVEWSPQFMLHSAFVRPEEFCMAGCMASIEMSKNRNPTFLYMWAPIWKMVPVSVTHQSLLWKQKASLKCLYSYTWIHTVCMNSSMKTFFFFLELEINNKSSFICVPAWSGCQIPVASFSQLVYHLEMYKG